MAAPLRTSPRRKRGAPGPAVSFPRQRSKAIRRNVPDGSIGRAIDAKLRAQAVPKSTASPTATPKPKSVLDNIMSVFDPKTWGN